MAEHHLHLMINAYATRVWRPANGDIVDLALMEDDVQLWLNDLVQRIGMKAVFPARAKYVTAKGNAGITASINIETSHIAFHVWDEQDPAHMQFDLYTCGPLKHEEVVHYLNEEFGYVSGEWAVIDRSHGFKQIAQGEFTDAQHS
jgi:S-adenosylmethionine/arginine decarboxylase-like enzyme